MLQKIIRLGATRHFYHFCGFLLPWCFIVSLGAILYGLFGGLFIAPSDYQQGEGFRIIYVHVPCAILSLLIYISMAVFSSIYLIWRIKIADIIAYCSASVGAVFTVCALLTGAIWGKPMWGAWWVWDARLTSELILLFLYLGYLGLYHAIPKPQTAAKVSALLAVVGAIDIPIIHYSVYWWQTLHQGATLRWGQSAIDSSMLIPLLSMIVGLIFYTIALMCLRIRTEILKREAHHSWTHALMNKMLIIRNE